MHRFKANRRSLDEKIFIDGEESFWPSDLSFRKIHYDDDYVALNVADELEEEETLSGPEKMDESQGRYHRPRRKRKRKRRKIDPVGPDEELVDPEELPPRARWTIVATACLLLAMSLLLVGVTLRMAPIIDDMGKSIAMINPSFLIKWKSSVARLLHLIFSYCHRFVMYFVANCISFFSSSSIKFAKKIFEKTSYKSVLLDKRVYSPTILLERDKACDLLRTTDFSRAESQWLTRCVRK